MSFYKYLEDAKSAFTSLVNNLTPALKGNDDFCWFLIRSLHNNKMTAEKASVIQTFVSEKDAVQSRDLLIRIGDMLIQENDRDLALNVFKKLHMALP